MGLACTPTDGPSIVLRAVTPDAAGEPAAVQLDRFADEVERLSGGEIQVEPRYLAAGRDTPRYDQVTAGLVADGDAELGWIPSRTWDTEGVTSLRALNTPFLVTSDELLEAVLSDDDIRERLLSGLPDAEVVGIDVVPEGLRHPFGFDEPLLGADDYAGEVIRSPESATVWATLEAFGATPVQLTPDAGSQRGMESAYESTHADFATSNVTFFPKANALVAGVDVRARLSEAQWSLLTRAADATRRWAFDTRPSDRAEALAFCARGGSVVAATDSDLQSLHDAAQGVTKGLERDPLTSSLIADIRSLGRGLAAPDPLEQCPESPSPVPDGGARLNGEYTFEASEDALRAAGVTTEARFQEYAGRFDIVIDYPDLHVHHEAEHAVAEPDWTSRISYDEGVLTIYWTSAEDDWTSARVRVDDDGSLVFSDYREGVPDPEFFAIDRVWLSRWQRVDGSRDR